MLCWRHLITCVWFFPWRGSRVVLGIRNLAPITSNYTPHQRAVHFLGTFSADIYIQPNAPTFVSVLFFHQFPWVPTNCHKSGKWRQNAKLYWVKMKAEGLDSGWYLFVRWLHMFGFGFQGFAASHPAQHPQTLYTPRLILSHTHQHYANWILRSCSTLKI